MYTLRTTTARITLTLLASLCPLLTAGGEPDVSDELPEILVSRQLLEGLELAMGDVVSLARDYEGGGARPFRIVGVYEPTPDPMRLTSKRREARLHLPDLLDLTAQPGDPLSTESVTDLNLALVDPADAPAFAADLSARVPGLVASSVADAEDDAMTFAVLERFHVAISVVTVLGSTAFLLALMIMRADERRETVGILRLVGLSKSRILLLVLMEGLFVAVAGAVFGILFALATEDVANRFFQWHYDTALVFVRVTAGIAWRCVAIAVPLGVLAGLVASWTLLRRDVVALLRR